MSAHDVNGVRIEVEDSGPSGAPVLLLIRGLASQLIHWPEAFLAALSQAGFRVLRFDNRDAGLSQKFHESGVPDLGAVIGGRASPPYTLADMAADAVGVLDARGVERAHVAGMSLGGMVAQHVAFSHPARCLSVTSIMSSSGAPGLPPATPEAMEALTSTPADPTDRECVIAHNMRTQRVIESPAYPPTAAELREYFERGYDRCYCPDGSQRQMAAALADGSRAERLSRVAVPMLVLHGADDPLIHPACGEDTARRVPGAKLEIVRGMGHDVTTANAPIVAGHLIAHARSVDGGLGPPPPSA
jgi:pimeloyl-ACP methyl ester carboxylesterase